MKEKILEASHGQLRKFLFANDIYEFTTPVAADQTLYHPVKSICAKIVLQT